MDRFEDVRDRIMPLADGSPMRVDIKRDGKDMSLTVTPRISDEKDVFGKSRKALSVWVSSDPDQSADR